MDIKIGSSGPLVYVVQEQLALRFAEFRTAARFQISGKFDKETEEAVKEFQTTIDLDPTGIIDDLTSSCIVRSTFDFENLRPTIVAQPIDKNHCWAAATSSWQAAMGRPISSVEALVDKFKKINKALDPSDSITNSGWLHLKNLYQMDYIGFGLSVNPPAKLLSNLTISLLFSLLKRKKYLLIAYNYDDTIAHTVLAYGIRVTFGAIDPSDRSTVLPDYRVKVMDPLVSWGIPRRELRTFKSSRAVVLFYAR